MVQGSDPWGHPEAKRQMVQCSVLRPMGKPIGKTTHRWLGVPNTRTRTHGETHIEEAALRAASTQGGGRLRPPPPCVDSFMDGCVAVAVAEAVAEADQSIHDQSIHEPNLQSL